MEVVASTSAFFVKLICIDCVLCLVFFSQNHPGVDCQNIWNNDKLRTLAQPFQAKFTGFVTHALQKEALTDLFHNNIHGRETRESSEHGPLHRRQTLRPEEAAQQLMSDLKAKLVLRYSAVVAALRRLRQAFEDSLTRPGLEGPQELINLCCSPGTLEHHFTLPSMSYEAGYQDLVDTQTGCFGTAGPLVDPSRMVVGDTLRVMKDNYKNWTGLLWQYVTSTDEFFLQFPNKDRHCGPNGTVTYPFLQRREVEKLLQPKLNLVILLDASSSMSQPVSSGAASPASHLFLTKEAVKGVISDLGFNDRVSVVIMNGANVSTPDCFHRLMPATERNAARIATFLESVNASDTRAPDFVEGFEKAYSLLQAERTFQGKKNVTEIVMIFTSDGYELFNIDLDKVLEVIERGEYSLGRTVTHLVYVSQSQERQLRTLDWLYMVADLNNLLISNAASWPPAYRIRVGPVGKLEVIQNTTAYTFKDTVKTYYRQFVQTMMDANAAERVFATAPHSDNKLGLLLSFAIPMYNSSLIKDYSSLRGAAAVDVSMTSLFDDVIHFNWMTMSYCFVVERNRGLVLVHPNMVNPSNMVTKDPIFAGLETLEPTLSAEYRTVILSANASIQSFGAQFGPGRNAFKTGLVLSGMPTTPATVVYSLVSGTDYVLVMVIFNKELEPVRLSSIHTANTSLDMQSFSHYRLSGTRDSAQAICAFSSDPMVTNSVTIKVSPDVFREPELHRNSHDFNNDPTNTTPFFNDIDFSIRPELRSSVVFDLGVVGSQRLSQLWKDTTNAPGVIARFVGTRNGVFAAYPGIWPSKTVIENDYSWYRLSLAVPGKVVVTLRRSLTTRDRFVVISTTVGDSDSIVGVSGAMVSRRGFAALVYNTVPECSDSVFSCHLLTEDGHFLDVLRESPEIEDRRHVTSVYPWLANEMIRQQILKPVWCTSLSRGRHTLAYALVVPEGQARNNTQDQNPCRRFLLHHVMNSNLFLLALLNRQNVGCNSVDSNAIERCSSCIFEPEGYRCTQCMPKTASSPMTSICQCLCSCPVDVDLCDNSYQTHGAAFPLRSCHEEPEMPNLMPAGDPGNPSSAPPPCEMLCPTADSQERCEAMDSCQWNHETYPVCQASMRSTTIPPGLAGTTQRQAMGKDGSSGHGLGGGVIAGVTILATVVMAAAFLIAYYRLVKPRLFSRLREDTDEGKDDSTLFQSHDDSLTFTIHPSLPTSASPPPASTACMV